MMISSRQKKDSYEANSVPAPAGKYAGASWHELGMLNLLALPHKRKNMPALLAPKKYKILTTRKALVGFSLSLSLSLSHTHQSPQLLDYTHAHTHARARAHTHTHMHACMHTYIHHTTYLFTYMHYTHTYVNTDICLTHIHTCKRMQLTTGCRRCRRCRLRLADVASRSLQAPSDQAEVTSVRGPKLLVYGALGYESMWTEATSI
jgi:hypothetical protein